MGNRRGAHINGSGQIADADMTGMAIQAKLDFPGIDFSRSIMAGDSFSDMEFAQKAGIPRSLIGEKYENSKDTFKSQYNWFPDLLTFAKQLIKDIQA